VSVAHDHTQWHKLGRTPLDEGSALRRNLYLTTHNTHKRQKSMTPAGLEPAIPASQRPPTHALDRAITAIGVANIRSWWKGEEFDCQRYFQLLKKTASAWRYYVILRFAVRTWWRSAESGQWVLQLLLLNEHKAMKVYPSIDKCWLKTRISFYYH